MDRGAWQAAVHGVERVRHDLATKPPPPFLAALDLHRFAWAFSNCGKRRLLFAVCGLLIVEVSVVVEYRLWVRGLQW